MRRRRDYRSLLLKWFRSANIDKKVEAFEKLNLLPEKDRIDILFLLLEDPSWHLREMASRRIADYGEPVIGRLFGLLKSGIWYTRAAAAIALGEIGEKNALEPLIKVFNKDRNRTVIKEVTKAIAVILIKNEEDISYLNKFGNRVEFIKRLNEYWPEFKKGLGLRTD